MLFDFEMSIMDYFFYKKQKFGIVLPIEVNVDFIEIKNKPIKYSGSLSEVINKILEKERVSYLAYSKNKSIVITNRLYSILSDSKIFNDDSVAAFSRAFTDDGCILSCVYSQSQPQLPFYGTSYNIANASNDISFLDLKRSYRLIRSIPNWVDHAFNAMLIHQLKKENLTAKYDHRLMVGCVNYSDPDDIMAINELMRSRMIIPIRNYYTTTGDVKQLNSEASDLACAGPSVNKPTFSIIVRTRFDRVELLERALASLYFSKIKANATIEVLLVSDSMEKYPVKFKQIEDLLNLRKVKVAKAGVIPSRTINIIRGVQAANNSYISFLDDDDYVDKNYFSELSLKIVSANSDLIFYDAKVLKEKLSVDSGRLVILSEAEVLVYKAADALKFAKGVNMTPISGFMVRSAVLKDVVAKNLLMYDYSEDYTLLLTLLCEPVKIDLVNIILNYISIREDGDNTVTQVDRTRWLANIADHFSVLFDKEEVGKRLNLYASLTSVQYPQLETYRAAYLKLVHSL